jgi:hypothetical protein
VKPLLAGEVFAAKCLTEPRGGSDYFGATCTAEDKGDHSRNGLSQRARRSAHPPGHGRPRCVVCPLSRRTWRVEEE